MRVVYLSTRSTKDAAWLMVGQFDVTDGWRIKVSRRSGDEAISEGLEAAVNEAMYEPLPSILHKEWRSFTYEGTEYGVITATAMLL